ncbi:MAG: PhoH family protein [Candidatus Woesearchaeota archaeon]|nr:PhoH family protein [Candidatus Woesearchaeota archaeon]
MKTDDKKAVHKAWILTPKTFLQCSVADYQRFIPESPEKGANILILPNSFTDVPQNQEWNPFERQHHREFHEYAAKEGIQFDMPHQLAEGLYLIRASTPHKLSSQKAFTGEFLSQVMKHVRKQIAPLGAKWGLPINQNTPLEVLAEEIEVRSRLVGEGFVASELQFNKCDPRIAENYFVEFDPEGSGFAELMSRMYSQGKIQPVQERVFAEIMKNQLPAQEGGLPLILPNQFYSYTDPKGKIRLLRNKPKPVFEKGVITSYQPGAIQEVELHTLKSIMAPLWSPRFELHIRQYMLLELMLDPTVQRVLIGGGSGTGTTTVSFLSMLRQVLSMGDTEFGNRYSKVIVAKTHETLGGEKYRSGFLPGDKFEKLKEENRPYFDAYGESLLDEVPFHFLTIHCSERRGTYPGAEKLPLTPVVEFILLGEARGANFKCGLIDETQNAPEGMLFTLSERVNMGGKMAYMGDFTRQIDRPGYHAGYNGMTIGLNLMYSKPWAGVVTLTKNYRDLASREIRDAAPAY